MAPDVLDSPKICKIYDCLYTQIVRYVGALQQLFLAGASVMCTLLYSFRLHGEGLLICPLSSLLKRHSSVRNVGDNLGGEGSAYFLICKSERLLKLKILVNLSR
ncbi:hypothetical protein Pmani_009375 [Petrolisthes manimaculis]|uniref:Uncharacterized protein n=1 Tax=Petrolisthes manimaculis TaxID=1843537 RepID=A0AAE1Q4E0_9EUCA|nr:hypothetical protein Pmani_009375 [Petrolisthes manimaculis]